MVKNKIEYIIGPDGTEAFYKNGKRHRIGGPAVISPDGRVLDK
jgi:hypothetical protein